MVMAIYIHSHHFTSYTSLYSVCNMHLYSGLVAILRTMIHSRASLNWSMPLPSPPDLPSSFTRTVTCSSNCHCTPRIRLHRQTRSQIPPPCQNVCKAAIGIESSHRVIAIERTHRVIADAARTAMIVLWCMLKVYPGW
jgi:hypothetical protein